MTYDGALTLTVGTCGTYAPFENEGRMFYMNIFTANAANQIYRFDVKNRVLSPFTATDNIQGGTNAVGQRMATYAALDGTDTYDVVLLLSNAAVTAQELVVLV